MWRASASLNSRELAWKLLIFLGLREWSAMQHRVYYDSYTSEPSAIRVTPSLVWVAMTYVRLVPTSQRVIKILLRMIRALYEFHTIKGLLCLRKKRPWSSAQLGRPCWQGGAAEKKCWGEDGRVMQRRFLARPWLLRTRAAEPGGGGGGRHFHLHLPLPPPPFLTPKKCPFSKSFFRVHHPWTES